MADFDIQGAKAAGYSDAEIISHLSSSRSFDVDGARKSGYSDAEILSHLASAHTPQETAHKDFLAAKAAHPGMDVQELNTSPSEGHQQWESFKTDHPFLGHAMEMMFKNADIGLPIMGMSGPVAAATETASSDTGGFIRGVLQHPKTVAAMKDAAVDYIKGLAEEIPGVRSTKALVKGVGKVKDVIDDVRAEQAVSSLPTVPAAPPNGVPLRPPLAERMPTPPEVATAPEPSGPVVPVKPPLQSSAVSAYVTPETSGLQGPEAASRARAAGNIATKLEAQGVTEADLVALEKVPSAARQFWEKAGAFHREGYTPSPETMDAIKDILKTKTKLQSAPTITVSEEIPAYLQKNPKALAAAQALKNSMSISDLMNQGR